MDIVSIVVGAGVGAVLPLILFFNLKSKQSALFQEQEALVREQTQAVEKKAEALAKDAELQRKAERIKVREELEKELAERRHELTETERRMEKKESSLDRRFEQMDQRDRDQEKRRDQLDREQKEVAEAKARCQELAVAAEKKLEEVAGLTAEAAKLELKASIEEAARKESGRLLKELEDDVRANAQKKAQDVVVAAIQRFAGEFVAERTVSVVHLPNDDMKGRIIGREGRNIRAIEAATGCDLIIDDTPEAVVISGFNPIRREVARRTLDELITDGRIHPARIEDVARKNEKTVKKEVQAAGDQAIFDTGLHGIHPEIVKLLGQLKFRTSYTQNVLAHSIEVAFFAGIIAEELGLDGTMARRCGLLHDIGKAIDHEVEGGHAVIGGQFAKKYKEHPLVVNAISAHHFDEEPQSVYAPITNAADALSAARPGARREMMSTYVKRLDDLESVAKGFKGVEKVFAVQAGRELRVIVAYDRVNDEGSMMLARDIAKKVEEDLTYPGQIKVTVIREMRATEIAH